MKKDWRAGVEEQFEHLAHFIFNHKYIVFISMLFMVFALASNIPKITFDTSTEGFLYKDDPVIVEYNAFRNQFGRDEKIIIAVKTKDVFDSKFLKKLFKLHEEIEANVPYIKELNSLKNARKTTGDADALIVDDLFQDGDGIDQKRLSEIKTYAMANPIYKDLYINADATFTTIMITTNTYSALHEESNSVGEFSEDFEDDFADESEETTPIEQDFISVDETNEMILKIEEIIKKYQDENFKIYNAGSPIVTKNLQSTLMADMSKFILYIILTISILLFLMFKRLSGVILPLLIVIFALIATIASMALALSPITSMTQILPSLLLAVGIGDSVHLLSVFFQHFNKTGDKEASIAYALGHSGLAIVMTSVTTAASLASFIYSDIAPVSALGLFSALGVIYALFLTLVLLPAMIVIVPLKPHKHEEEQEHNGILDRSIDALGNFSINYPKIVLSSVLLLMTVSTLYATQMHFSHNPLHWFQKDNAVRVNTETIDKELRGSISIEVVLDTGKVNGVYNPEFLNAIEETTKTIYTYKGENYFIGKIVSINDVLKEIHKALNENRQEFYIIPQDPDLIAQEFLLFENSGSDDLEEIVDSQFSKTRLSIKAPWVDSIEYVELLDELELLFADKFGEEVKVSITGTLPILATTIVKSIQSSIESYIIAFAVIALLMVILIGSLKLGLLSMLPNLAPIMFGVAFMVIFDLPLDMFTILIGAIAIGMVVDDTIHYVHNFQRYYAQTQDVDRSIRMTIHSTGRAIFITSIVLGSGFFVFMFASMTNLFNFGLITGVTVLIAMLTNLTLTGSIMKLVIKQKKDK